MSFGHSKSFGLRPIEPLRVLRTLEITAFQALERGRYRPQGVSYLPPRPVNFYNTCGPAFLRPDGLEIIGPADAGP